MKTLQKITILFAAAAILLVSCEDKAKKLEQEKKRIADSIAYVDSVARVQFIADSAVKAYAVLDSLNQVRIADSLAAAAKMGKPGTRKAPAKTKASTPADGPSKGGAPGEVVKPGKGGAPSTTPTETTPVIKPGKGGAPGGGGR